MEFGKEKIIDGTAIAMNDEQGLAFSIYFIVHF